MERQLGNCDGMIHLRAVGSAAGGACTKTFFWYNKNVITLVKYQELASSK